MKHNFTTDRNFTSENTSQIEDPRVLATTYTLYKIGEGIGKIYVPILVPFGVIGNILSFLVMIQKHNRHMSFSLYISSLAVTDTIVLLSAFGRYLNMVLDIDMPPNQYWHCAMVIAIVSMSSISSTLLILSMTFERFYSIIRPHKATSFNTMKRAKISIIVIITFSCSFALPHLFLSTYNGRICLSNVNGFEAFYGQFYYWFTCMFQFVVAFVLLLIMNTVIIHTLRKRAVGDGQGKGQGQISKMKSSEKQIYLMLLFVTFGYLILATPVAIMTFYTNFVHGNTAHFFAGYHLFYHVGEKTFYTNYGINFYLYVISGQKFRSDLRKLFKCELRKQKGMTNVSSVKTETEDISTRTV